MDLIRPLASIMASGVAEDGVVDCRRLTEFVRAIDSILDEWPR